MKAETIQRATPSTPRRKSRKTFMKFMKITRRVHMYLGLLLVPWVILFGLGGFMFNHVSTFWGGSVKALSSHSPAQVSETAGFTAIDPEDAADQILAQINSDLPIGQAFSRASDANVFSELKLSARSDQGPVNIYIDLEKGSARFSTTQRPKPEQENPHYHNSAASLASFDLDSIITGMSQLSTDAGLPLKGKPAPSGRSNAQLRFDLEDQEGTRWHTVYDFTKGTLTGRSAASDTGMNFHTAVTRLHKTHHYPHKVSAKWIWILLGDITAISMVVWGVTGLIMWWQIQPTRAIGTLAIFLAAIASFFIFSGNLKEMSYAPVQTSQRGP